MLMIFNSICPFTLFNFMQHLTAMRQKGRFAGFSLYVSNTTDLHSGYLCYKDGPELPPLDFNITCLTNGHYIIFYNERRDEITYPGGYETGSVFMELCEVFVTGRFNYIAFLIQMRFKESIWYFFLNRSMFTKNRTRLFEKSFVTIKNNMATNFLASSEIVSIVSILILCVICILNSDIGSFCSYE